MVNFRLLVRPLNDFTRSRLVELNSESLYHKSKIALNAIKPLAAYLLPDLFTILLGQNLRTTTFVLQLEDKEYTIGASIPVAPVVTSWTANSTEDLAAHAAKWVKTAKGIVVSCSEQETSQTVREYHTCKQRSFLRISICTMGKTVNELHGMLKAVSEEIAVHRKIANPALLCNTSRKGFNKPKE
ncbi:hypothetical protein Tco_1057673 [Tanacetum coccineum]|uniref:Uncharacterized protein n=1 Tax=Tanacetum coccineum TaxID=301880 RepID=A0ABQ5H674_9ASTR